MNNNFDMDKLRFLLHKYYEAETSPEEEKLLMAFFSETDAENIPQDLTADRILFSSMKELLPCQTDLEAPDGLLEKIYQNIRITPHNVSMDVKEKWKKPFLYAVIAAIACLVLSLGIRYFAISNISKPPVTKYVVEAPSFSTGNSPTVISDSVKAPTGSKSSDQKPSVTPPVSQSNQSVAETGVSPNEAEGYIEITDPEEAQKIVMEIGRLLANNSRETNEAIRLVENTVDEYKEISKSILQ